MNESSHFFLTLPELPCLLPGLAIAMFFLVLRGPHHLIMAQKAVSPPGCPPIYNPTMLAGGPSAKLHPLDLIPMLHPLHLPHLKCLELHLHDT